MKFNEMKIIFHGKKYDKFDYKKFLDKNNVYYDFKSKVIIMMKRTPDLLFAICMLLEKGITYIPVDPEYPKERIQYIISNSGADSIITDMDFEFVLPNKAGNPVCTTDIAYILFTSGSTGTPKGVEVTREGLANFIDGISEIIDFSYGKSIACLTTVSFDIFFLESIMALYKGLTVVLADDNEQRNPKLMARLIEDNNVDMIQMTPSRLQLLLNYDKELVCLKNVKEIMVGGEPLSLGLLNILHERTNAKIYNMYGPTETTIYSTVSDLTDKKIVDIGKPIMNTQIYIIDEKNNSTLNGTKGELCIGGKGLARGYLNMPGLTAERFVQNPFVTTERMYKTGDLARWLPDGNIEYLGRTDSQVKVRGYRIEMGEIEAVLLKHKFIKQAIVTVCQENNSYLCAYYVSDEELLAADLKQYLGGFLPDYMIPSYYIRLDEVPQTPNGKIDRKALSDSGLKIVFETQQKKVKYQDKNQDATHVGYKVREIIRNIIDIPILTEDIDEVNNLDNLGINSITFIKIVVAIEMEFDFEFEDEDLDYSKFATVQSLVDYVKNRVNGQS